MSSRSESRLDIRTLNMHGFSPSRLLQRDAASGAEEEAAARYTAQLQAEDEAAWASAAAVERRRNEWWGQWACGPMMVPAAVILLAAAATMAAVAATTVGSGSWRSLLPTLPTLPTLSTLPSPSLEAWWVRVPQLSSLPAEMAAACADAWTALVEPNRTYPAV